MAMTDIMLRVVGSQIENGEEQEQLEFITEGTLDAQADHFHLTYEESEVSGMPGCSTHLKIAKNEQRINMMRLGKDNMSYDTEIEFITGKRHNGYYATPYGPLEMEVLTNSINGELDKDDYGMIALDYSIALKGLLEGRNKLQIEIKKPHGGEA